jgi:hypothetical protein
VSSHAPMVIVTPTHTRKRTVLPPPRASTRLRPTARSSSSGTRAEAISKPPTPGALLPPVPSCLHNEYLRIAGDEPREKFRKTGCGAKPEVDESASDVFVEETEEATVEAEADKSDDVESVLSDEEEDRQQADMVAQSIDSLVAKEVAQGVDPATLKALKLARSLIQLHICPTIDDGDSVPVNVDASASPAEPSTLPMPQARAYMHEKGFTEWDEVIGGHTLVSHCCHDAVRRMPMGPKRFGSL